MEVVEFTKEESYRKQAKKSSLESLIKHLTKIYINMNFSSILPSNYTRPHLPHFHENPPNLLNHVCLPHLILQHTHVNKQLLEVSYCEGAFWIPPPHPPIHATE